MPALFEKLKPYYAFLPILVNFYFLYAYHLSYRIFTSDSAFIDRNTGLFSDGSIDYVENFELNLYLLFGFNLLLFVIYLVKLKKLSDTARLLYTIIGYIITVIMFYSLSINHSLMIARRYSAFELESANDLRMKLDESGCDMCLREFYSPK